MKGPLFFLLFAFSTTAVLGIKVKVMMPLINTVAYFGSTEVLDLAVNTTLEEIRESSIFEAESAANQLELEVVYYSDRDDLIRGVVTASNSVGIAINSPKLEDSKSLQKLLDLGVLCPPLMYRSVDFLGLEYSNLISVLPTANFVVEYHLMPTLLELGVTKSVAVLATSDSLLREELFLPLSATVYRADSVDQIKEALSQIHKSSVKHLILLQTYDLLRVMEAAVALDLVAPSVMWFIPSRVAFSVRLLVAHPTFSQSFEPFIRKFLHHSVSFRRELRNAAPSSVKEPLLNATRDTSVATKDRIFPEHLLWNLTGADFFDGALDIYWAWAYAIDAAFSGESPPLDEQFLLCRCNSTAASAFVDIFANQSFDGSNAPVKFMLDAGGQWSRAATGVVEQFECDGDPSSPDTRCSPRLIGTIPLNKTVDLVDRLRWDGEWPLEDTISIPIATFGSMSGSVISTGSGNLKVIKAVIDSINSNSSILPGYEIVLEASYDSQCSPAVLASQFSKEIVLPAFETDLLPVVAFIGPQCSGSSAMLRNLNNFTGLGIPAIAPSADQFDVLRLTPGDRLFALRTLMADSMEFSWTLNAHFGWEKSAVFNNGARFATVAKLVRNAVDEGIQMQSRVVDDSDDELVDAAIRWLLDEDLKIVTVVGYPEFVARLMCGAVLAGRGGEGFAWIIEGWFSNNWWVSAASSTRCTAAQLETEALFAVGFRILNVRSDDLGPLPTGELPSEWLAAIYDRFGETLGGSISFFYDATVLMALALHQVLLENTGVDSVTVEELLDANNDNSRRLLFDAMSAQSFASLSGAQFDVAADGPRRFDVMQPLKGSSMLSPVANLEVSAGNAVTMEGNVSFVGGVVPIALLDRETSLHSLVVLTTVLLVTVLPTIGYGLFKVLRKVSAVNRERDLALAAGRAKIELLANVSHDLRTPLHGIAGMLQLLRKFGPYSRNEITDIDYISSCSKQLESVISDLLEFSAIEAGKIHGIEGPCPLLRAVEEGLRFGWNPSHSGVQVSFTIDSAIQWCKTDERRFAQTLSLLVNNAAKFTSRGAVEVSVSVVSSANHIPPNAIRPNRRGAEPFVFAGESQDNADSLDEYDYEGPVAMVRVKDTGPGIGQDKARSLFDVIVSSETADARIEGGGTGLGLGIARFLVCACLKGRIWCENSPEGATACFSIPFLPTEPRVAAGTRLVSLHGESSSVAASTPGGGEEEAGSVAVFDSMFVFAVAVFPTAHSARGMKEQLWRLGIPCISIVMDDGIAPQASALERVLAVLPSDSVFPSLLVVHEMVADLTGVVAQLTKGCMTARGCPMVVLTVAQRERETADDVVALFEPVLLPMLYSALVSMMKNDANIGIPLAEVSSLPEEGVSEMKKFYLPAFRQESTLYEGLTLFDEVCTRRVSPSPATASKIQVLVADDAPINLTIIMRMLEQAGVSDVLTATDGAEAVEKFEGSLEPIQLVLLDVNMPRLNGFQAAIRIRRLKGGDKCVIIAATATITTATVEAAAKAGIDFCLLKPVSVEDLAHILKSIR